MLNFLYCFDKNYNKQAATAISSLADNCDEKVNIFIIHENPSSFEKYRKKLLQKEFIFSITIKKFVNNNYDFPNLKGAHVSLATYYRIFIKNYIPKNIEFLTYIDADVVCLNNPIKSIYKTINQMKLKNYNIAGRTEGTQEISKNYFSNLGYKGNKYFNAGIVVINYQQWLNQKTQDDLIKIMKDKYNQILYWDQDVLNCYYNGDFLDLDKNLNYKLELEINDIKHRERIKDEVIFLHYSGNGKPWNYDSVTKLNSFYYQDAYNKFFNFRFHTDIKLTKHDIKNLINLFVFKKNPNSIGLKLFIKNLIILFKKLLKYNFNK